MKAEKFYRDFTQATKRLNEALAEPATSDLIQAGCIQYFEFCFELAWKTIKALIEAEGLPRCHSPKSCLKQAFALGWIDDQKVWLAMLDARNRMSHTYNAEQAQAIYEQLSVFLPVLQDLSTFLESEVKSL